MRVHPRDIVAENLVCHCVYRTGLEKRPVKMLISAFTIVAQVYASSHWHIISLSNGRSTPT
jgi:hypothetical protein